MRRGRSTPSNRSSCIAARRGMSAAATAISTCATSSRFLEPAGPRLVAVGGLSGTGKSTLAAAVAPGLRPAPGAVHLRSDVVRKRIMRVGETARLPPEGYATAVTHDVYAALRRQTALALGAGYSVVVDAVHAEPAELPVSRPWRGSAASPSRGSG